MTNEPKFKKGDNAHRGGKGMSKDFYRIAFNIPSNNKISEIIQEIQRKFNGQLSFASSHRALTSDAKLIKSKIDDGDKQLIETLSVYLPEIEEVKDV